MRLKVSRNGIELIKAFEGTRLTSARLPDGRWVIGHGHTRSAREGVTITAADAEALLIFDLIGVVEAVTAAVTAPLNQNQFDALCAFCFNVGAEAFKTSEVVARLNEGRHTEAALALDLWRKAELGGDPLVLDALIRRRAAEKALFLTPPGGFAPAPSPLLRPESDPQAEAGLPRRRPAEFALEEKGAAVVAVRIGPIDPEPEPEPDPEPVDTAPEHRGGAEPAPEPAPVVEEPASPDPEPDPAVLTEPGAEALEATVPAPAATAEPVTAAVLAARMFSAYPGAIGALPPRAIFKAPEPAEEPEQTAEPQEAAAAGELPPPEVEPPPAFLARPEPEAAPEPEPELELAPEPEAEPRPAVTAAAAPAVEPLVLTPPPEVETLEAEPELGPVWTPARPAADAAEAPLFDEPWAAGRPAPRIIRHEERVNEREERAPTAPYILIGVIGLVAFFGAVSAFLKAGGQTVRPTDPFSDPYVLGWTLAVMGAACVGFSVYTLLKRLGGVRD